MSKTILAIGAHYDDCVFGLPGILLKAVKNNHHVVILTLIGNYSNWKPARGRERILVDGTVGICKDYGVGAMFMNFAEMHYDVTDATKRAVAEAVAEIQPDIAFMLWPRDSHVDHEVASQLSKIALLFGDRLLPPDRSFRSPQKIYMFDNGPRHTVGFEPDTYVDVTGEWPKAIEWLGRLMALLRDQEYEPDKRDPAQRAKETLAMYRGQTCGVQYAEALRSASAYPQEIL